MNSRNWSIVDFHESGSKNVIKLRNNGKDLILKMQHPFPHQYNLLDERVSDKEFTDTVSVIAIN